MFILLILREDEELEARAKQIHQQYRVLTGNPENLGLHHFPIKKKSFLIDFD
jgi:hypothetical protein